VADLATNIDGDLTIQGGSLGAATPRDRDRNLIMTRIMTMQGEIRSMPFFGVPSRIIGSTLDAGSLNEIETLVRQSLFLDTSLASLALIVRGLILGRNKVAVLVQSQKRYSDDSEEKLTVKGEYYTMGDKPMTLLNGKEG